MLTAFPNGCSNLWRSPSHTRTLRSCHNPFPYHSPHLFVPEFEVAFLSILITWTRESDGDRCSRPTPSQRVHLRHYTCPPTPFSDETLATIMGYVNTAIKNSFTPVYKELARIAAKVDKSPPLGGSISSLSPAPVRVTQALNSSSARGPPGCPNDTIY